MADQQSGAVGLYQFGIAPPVGKRIEDEAAFSDALSAFVNVCVDVLVVDKMGRRVFLARRRAQPAAGWWWYIGGRVLPGQDFSDAASRIFRRETELSVHPVRFKYCGEPVRYWFPDRAQVPQDAGTDSLCFTYVLELTNEERARIQLDRNEYLVPTLEEFTYDELIRSTEIPLPVRHMCMRVFESDSVSLRWPLTVLVALVVWVTILLFTEGKPSLTFWLLSAAGSGIFGWLLVNLATLWYDEPKMVRRRL